MEQPQPAEGWPERPLSEAEARERFEDARAIWVMDPNSAVRSTALPPDAPENPVVDLVAETEAAFEMYSYTGGRWMNYGTQRKDDAEAPPMAGTLESYRVLAGASELDVDPDAG